MAHAGYQPGFHPHGPSRFHTFLAKGLGATMWFFIFYRARELIRGRPMVMAAIQTSMVIDQFSCRPASIIDPLIRLSGNATITPTPAHLSAMREHPTPPKSNLHESHRHYRNPLLPEDDETVLVLSFLPVPPTDQKVNALSKMAVQQDVIPYSLQLEGSGLLKSVILIETVLIEEGLAQDAPIPGPACKCGHSPSTQHPKVEVSGVRHAHVLFF
ncbi:hypothetical protein FRC00_010487 [Tulasnella sp. 408]|nr:hypothetical protein FRC00_010487 [Tulasnella sp. 408]